QVYFAGIPPPSLNAVLVSVTPALAPLTDVDVDVDADVGVLVVVAVFADLPPPPPQATSPTSSTGASLRSTRSFYSERGSVADGVEPSAVSEEAIEAEGVVLEAAGLEPIDARTILRTGGPRFAANAGFPVIFFYAG